MNSYINKDSTHKPREKEPLRDTYVASVSLFYEIHDNILILKKPLLDDFTYCLYYYAYSFRTYKSNHKRKIMDIFLYDPLVSYELAIPRHSMIST